MDRKSEMDRFGRMIVGVRDRAIADCDMLNAGRVRGPSGRRWANVAAPSDKVHELIPTIVDAVLYELLREADDGNLGWRLTSGEFVSLEAVGWGELAGWYVGEDEDAWRHRFSEQRIVD